MTPETAIARVVELVNFAVIGLKVSQLVRCMSNEFSADNIYGAIRTATQRGLIKFDADMSLVPNYKKGLKQ